jgi:hypothetical protein
LVAASQQLAKCYAPQAILPRKAHYQALAQQMKVIVWVGRHKAL